MSKAEAKAAAKSKATAKELNLHHVRSKNQRPVFGQALPASPTSEDEALHTLGLAIADAGRQD